MAPEQEKAERELAAFHDFLVRASLPIEATSVEKRHPPEPDILCRHRDEGLIAFELTALCDPDIASRLAPYRLGTVEAFMTSDPSSEIIRRKLAKKYKTPHPIELLIYNDGRVITPYDVVIPTIRPIIESRSGGPFRRVWFSGEETTATIYDRRI